MSSVRSTVILAATFALLAGRAAAVPALHVIPFPGTPDAAPLSQIIFSSLRPSDVSSVIVTASSTGVHDGHLISLPAHAGTAFVPDHPFAAGEHVTVTATLSSPAAGTASGDPGATTLHFSFTIAAPATSGSAHAGAAGPPTDSIGGRPASGGGGGEVQDFRSAPNLHPPRISMTADPDAAAGDIFLTPVHAPQNGLMITDSRGRLVWFDHTPGDAANLQVQHYRGRPVLTWWQGPSLGDGEVVIMNRSYRIVKILHAAEGYAADVHEFLLTAAGTAFIDVSVPVKANLSSIGASPQGNVWDYEIQELDVRTGQLLWEWHALGHVPVSASYLGPPTSWPPYDYFHLNSIQQLPNGNLLICARNTWAVYEINKQTGRVIWTLGGRHSDFKIGPGANFEWQHDARMVGNTVSLFDDADAPQEERQSSAKILRLNTTTMRASLIRRYRHRPPLLAASAGSTQILPNHHVLVGWGDQPDFSEYAAGGETIFDGRLPLGERSYRVYRFPWSARPLTRPAVAISPQSDGNVRVYVSWNGATAVAAWRVRGGQRRTTLRTLGDASRSGFETTIVLHSRPRYVLVQALSAGKKVIGSSRIRRL